MIHSRCGLLAALGLSLLGSGAVLAQPAEPGRSLWEAGLALGGGWVSDYPGADQNHGRGLVVPYLSYRGPMLRIDREGISGRMVNNRDFELDFTASAAFNARDSDARQGMPALDYMFGLGPQLIYKGLRNEWGSPTLRLKVRALASTDLHSLQGRGVMVDPELRWRFSSIAVSPFGGGPAALNLGLQPIWASRAASQYFYQVEPAQAKAGRPAYAARAGYLGTELSLGLSGRQSDSLSWFVSARGMSLHGAANSASPLLRSQTNYSVGAGLIWTPWRSEARAAD
jgi:outer membrane scaffolding protein for murein synthesis (MipA/OmpV family)